MTTIGELAFNNCERLLNITVGKGVTSIGERAFDGCYKLVEVVNKSALPITVGNDDYGYITRYARQVITDEKDSNIIKEKDYIFYNDNGRYYLIDYKGNETELTLPDNINGNNYAINRHAFWCRADLQKITIPNSIITVGSNAFYGCSGLIQTENGISYVDKWVVDCEYSTAPITLRTDTKGIADYAFYNCSNSSVTMGNSVTTIGEFAFGLCFHLTEITIPDSVTFIGDSAFYWCSDLTQITIPDSVTYIGSSTFGRCDSLTSVTFENTSGWEADDVALSSTVLADPTNAAIYFRYTYCDYTWTRSDD